MDTLKKAFASKLLKIKAIKLQPNNPFTWASGWKSPFYCDNRKALSYPDLRSYVKLELVHAVLEHFPQADAVAGVATGAMLVLNTKYFPLTETWQNTPGESGFMAELSSGLRLAVLSNTK